MIRRFAVVFLVASPLFAASTLTSPQTKQFTAKVDVNASCSITSLATLDFATYDPLTTNASSAQPGSTSINFKCTRGSHPLISLDAGSNAAGGSRTMITGTGGLNKFLNYTLVQPTSSGSCDPAGAPWGDGTTFGSKYDVGVTSVAPTTGQSVTICGYIGGGQDASAGSYTDSVIASVEF